MKRIITSLCHPIIVLAIIAGLLWFGWSQYLLTIQHLSTPKHNILPNSQFDKWEPTGLPTGWLLHKGGVLEATASPAPDYSASRGMQLVISDYKSGDALLLSPKVDLKPQTNYLYKGYYLASVSFDFLVRYFYKDGTSQLRLVRQYPFFDDPWSTVSTAFNTGDNITAVQIGYRVANNGKLQLKGLYLESADDVFIPKAETGLPNLLTNGDIHTTDGWQTVHNGNIQADFAHTSEDGQPYLHLVIGNTKDGEAKWAYPALPVVAGQRFAVSLDYRASMPTELVAEYTLQNGKTQFEVVDNLTPASDWTHIVSRFEAPPGALSMIVVPIAHQNGILDSRRYAMNDLTRPGAMYYKRPLVSLSFDDGWQSAYDTGASMLEEYGYRGTFYVNPGVLGNDKSFMQESNLLALLRRGHQIASHGFEHMDMTAISRDELVRQLGAARGYLEKRLKLYYIDFATPYGKDDPQVQAVIRHNYRSHRGTESGINTRQNFDPYNLRVMFVRTDTPLTVIQQQIDEAKSTNGWLILTYHRIENGDNHSEMITSPNVFKQHLALIKQSGITVSTVHDALNELEPQ